VHSTLQCVRSVRSVRVGALWHDIGVEWCIHWVINSGWRVVSAPGE
jgi:hypothetical protein